MDLSNLDIVYFLKDSAFNDELKYSLRSVEQNFPHNRIWFVGGRPCNLTPDKQIIVKQEGKTKWDRVRNMMSLVVQNPDITPNFVLFNDDFFVLKRVDRLPLYYSGKLIDLIYRIELVNGCKPTPYTASLKRTLRTLREAPGNYGEENFELHIPMVFNRETLGRIIKLYPNVRGTRSLYGNYVPADKVSLDEDVKIWNMEDEPKLSWIFCSTEDKAFAEGKVGKYIREMFNTKSKYEK